MIEAIPILIIVIWFFAFALFIMRGSNHIRALAIMMILTYLSEITYSDYHEFIGLVTNLIILKFAFDIRDENVGYLGRSLKEQYHGTINLVKCVTKCVDKGKRQCYTLCANKVNVL